MTAQSPYPIPPAIVPAIVSDPDEAADVSERETVGASDADADAIRAGAEGDLRGADRDSDGVPVGRADAEADAERAARESKPGESQAGT